MRFLQEKYSRRYFLFLICFAAALLLFIIFLSWLHGKECENLLYENEQMIVSSLIEQGIPSAKIAAALKNRIVSEESLVFLRQIGHTESVSFRLFPSINQSVFLFAKTAVGMIGIFSIVLVLSSVRFLRFLENIYRTAAGIIVQFSNGNFENHLPQNESGTLFQLFAAMEEMASALQSKRENERHTKEFLKNTISDISHQLKTPLAALNMYMEIILDEPDNTETIKKFSEKSMQSLERIEQLIQSLLKMARLDAGSIDFCRKRNFVRELISCAVGDLTVRAEAEKKKIIVEGDSAETLFCDLQWTSEAVGNLIKNALDHTSAGGTIRIEWKRSPAMLRLTISDDGCGIAEEDIHHIFKRFYRSRHANAPKSVNVRQGAGLGLPLAKAIIEGQNGVLSVNSAQGRGTTFTITFLTDS